MGSGQPQPTEVAAPVVASTLVRQILIGGARSGLDVAGTVLVGPAWPVLRGALGPVLDRLTEKLGGADPVSSVETAEKAAAAFDQDPRLAELLRTNLVDALEPVRAGQERLEEGFQTLHEVVNETNADVRRMLTEGVVIDAEAQQRLVEATAERVATLLEVRGFLGREIDPADAPPAPPWASREELVSRSDAAIAGAGGTTEQLEGQRQTLALALAETPTDVGLRLQYGYVLKALGQAAVDRGDDAAAADWLTRAETIFRLALREPPASETERQNYASAANGLGNVLAERGLHRQAIELYRDAVQLEPTYGYAWHDLFGSLVALADAGEVHAEALDAAWSGLEASAPAYPELSPEYLEHLRRHYDRVRGG